MESVRFVTLNVRGIRGDKRYAIFRWLVEKQYDIVFLQETYCTDSFVKKFNHGWSGDIYHSTATTNHSKGICVLFRKNLNYELIDVHEICKGRALLVNISIAGNTFTLVNVYAPNEVRERIKFFNDVNDAIQSYAVNKQSILIGGDFNCVNSKEDKVSSITLDKSHYTLCKLKESLQVIDIWRALHKDETS